MLIIITLVQVAFSVTRRLNKEASFKMERGGQQGELSGPTILHGLQTIREKRYLAFPARGPGSGGFTSPAG